jgi:hypothetical protein
VINFEGVPVLSRTRCTCRPQQWALMWELDSYEGEQKHDNGQLHDVMADSNHQNQEFVGEQNDVVEM